MTKIKDREGKIISEKEGQGKILDKLYETKPGRAALKILVQPEISKAGGAFLDSRFSKPLISSFISKNNIIMEEYEEEEYESYNHFFGRRMKEGKREFSKQTEDLCAPCDGRLSVYPITEEGTFCIKNTYYTLESLVRSEKLEEKYLEGTICIFRLCAEDYHHYCYVDDGEKSRNFHIPGVFHAVNGAVKEKRQVYSENTREFSILQSKNFGSILMMEVGAMLVGKIINHHEKQEVRRGMEKGMFEFGGSTVILAFQRGKVILDEDIVKNTEDGYETYVKMGEKIGRKG